MSFVSLVSCGARNSHGKQLLALRVGDFAGQGRRALAQHDDSALEEDLAVQRRGPQVRHVELSRDAGEFPVAIYQSSVSQME